MIKLNLTANGTEQERILAYLQKNASELFADKINNGTTFVKDGKTLINKKTLDDFMKFACDEARKQTAKGASAACIDDPVVFGWAIDYFEEDSIEGKLYNGDGTEYVPSKPVKKSTPTITKPIDKPKHTNQQASLFEMMTETTKKSDNSSILPSQPQAPESKKGSPMYQRYLSVKEKYQDCIVFYRLGDFYEMFGDDAKTSANELNLTLTGRDCGLDERVPMTGIPYHAIDSYISKLVNKGYKIAVVEPLGDTTSERVITGQDGQTVDMDTGEILSEEMCTETSENILEKEREIAKAFDKEALIILSDLLGDIFILE